MFSFTPFGGSVVLVSYRRGKNWDHKCLSSIYIANSACRVGALVLTHLLLQTICIKTSKRGQLVLFSFFYIYL